MEDKENFGEFFDEMRELIDDAEKQGGIFARVDDLDKTGQQLRNDDMDDYINHPSHYTSHPSGVECIEIARHYCYSIGAAIKYLWRAGLKHEQGKSDKDKEIEDLKKAVWYINDRIKQLENQ